MKKIFDLPVCGYDRAKSFYGKAKVIETDNGEKVLQSYNTFVCRITAAGNRGGIMQPVETEKPKTADMTPAESLKAMYKRRAANSVNY